MQTIRAFLLPPDKVASVVATGACWHTLLEAGTETLLFPAPDNGRDGDDGVVAFMPLQARVLEPVDVGSVDPLDAAELRAALALLEPLGLGAGPLYPDDLDAAVHARCFDPSTCSAFVAKFQRSETVSAWPHVARLRGLVTTPGPMQLHFTLALDTAILLARTDPAWMTGRDGHALLAPTTRADLSDEGIFAPLVHGFPPSTAAVDAWLAARWQRLLRRLGVPERGRDLLCEVDLALRRTWSLTVWARRAAHEERSLVLSLE